MTYRKTKTQSALVVDYGQRGFSAIIMNIKSNKCITQVFGTKEQCEQYADDYLDTNITAKGIESQKYEIRVNGKVEVIACFCQGEERKYDRWDVTDANDPDCYELRGYDFDTLKEVKDWVRNRFVQVPNAA